MNDNKDKELTKLLETLTKIKLEVGGILIRVSEIESKVYDFLERIEILNDVVDREVHKTDNRNKPQEQKEK